MKATDISPIKRTRKLEALLNKYGVTERNTVSVVQHETTKEETLVPQLEFAVFEAAIKAVYASWASHDVEAFEDNGHAGWYRRLAHKNGFTLPSEFTGTSESYAADYHYCVKLIADAGLYFALLD